MAAHSPQISVPPLHPPPRRILVKEVNWLGDVAMSLPALRAIRSAWPEAHLTVLIKKELVGFFDGLNWVNEVLPYQIPRGLKGLAARQRVIRAIKNNNFDLAVMFPNSFESAFWCALAGVPRRAGFARDARGPLLTHKVKPTPEILEVHQVHYYLYMLEQTLGIKGDPHACAIEPHQPHREKMTHWLTAHRRRPQGPLIALAVAAAYGPAKEWPAAQFAHLIDLLAEQLGAECVLVGAPNERARAEEVARLSKSGALVAAGETGIGEALALLSLCDAFAGNDSGSMHLAGPLGLPTVGIYGSTRADRTGPLGPRTKILYRKIECSPCLKRTCRFGHYECLKKITPAEVAGALREMGVGRKY